MSPVSVSTRQQRFAHARLPDPHLTRHARLFHIAHHGRVAAPAACGGLKPPPAGRLRRADNPSSPAQHRFTKLYLHRTPFHVRDTPTSRCPNSSPPSSDTPTPAPNASVPPPRVRHGSSPKFHATRDTLAVQPAVSRRFTPGCPEPHVRQDLGRRHPPVVTCQRGVVALAVRQISRRTFEPR
jgi:hypothetical protein